MLQNKKIWLIASLLVLFSSINVYGYSISSNKVCIGGKKYNVKIIKVSLADCRLKIGLAKNKIGAVEPLSNIAKRNGAIAAINGSFFDAYTGGSIKLPYHNLVKDGYVVHIGNTGTTLGFDLNNDYRMERIKLLLRGSVQNGRAKKQAWYAYFVNRPGGASLFTSYWINSLVPGVCPSIIVRNGIVESISNGLVAIPKDGSILQIDSGEGSLASRFQTGSKVSCKIEYGNGDPKFWPYVNEAIGSGPRLVKNGQISCDPISEGFTSQKILSMSCQRSAVGVTKDKKLLLITCKATIQGLAKVMKSLGTYDAMNLDGGASSGLWANGRYLTTPGRNISNALLILKKQ